MAEAPVNDPSHTGAAHVRSARVQDAHRILQLINKLALEQIMLPRSPASVIEHLRDFVVVEEDGQFAGCGALHVVWSDMAEIRSIAVDPEHQGKGYGRLMAEHLIHEAEQLGIAEVFAFTYVPGFFTKLDFEVVPHESLPHKVFNDCLHCPKYQACDEIAVKRTLSPSPWGLPEFPQPQSPQRPTKA